MSATKAETVTVDREALYALLVEAEAVGGVMATLSGVGPGAATEQLVRLTTDVAVSAGFVSRGGNEDGTDAHPTMRVWWDAGAARCDEILGRTSEAVAS